MIEESKHCCRTGVGLCRVGGPHLHFLAFDGFEDLFDVDVGAAHETQLLHRGLLARKHDRVMNMGSKSTSLPSLLPSCANTLEANQ